MIGQYRRESVQLVFLAGTVTNAGNKPLVPNTYDLEIKINKKWIKLKKAIIPVGSTFSSDVQTINIPDVDKKDLLKIKQSVTSSSPLYGCLMFITNEISLEELKNSEYVLRLTCFDIFNKKHETEFPKPKGELAQPTVFPKHDISVLTKMK